MKYNVDSLAVDDEVLLQLGAPRGVLIISELPYPNKNMALYGIQLVNKSNAKIIV